MAEFRSALRAYHLDRALAADRGNDCLVLHVSRDESGQSVPSHAHVIEQVNHLLHHAYESVCAATKLYIIGDWTSTPCANKDNVDPGADDFKEHLDDVQKWREASEKMGELLEQMNNLKEATWISGLPFLVTALEKLPTSLTKLVVDLGKPVRLEQDGDVFHKSYITPDELKPLLAQVKLKELRLFHVHNTFQPLVWETVFRNTSNGGMRILDIQMAVAPIVRSGHWKKANDVVGLTVALDEAEQGFYKGMDGKGCLHYNIGTGEYLDDYSIRKARIASGLDEAMPLPLWCLKLDGFVIDHLPFQHELSNIILLTCGENCIDSGLRAPKTGHVPQNKWSKAINNATSHCLIQWPNWTGIFDNRGDQRDQLGLVIPQGRVVSTPLDEFSPSSPTMPLTEASLHMKDLTEAPGMPAISRASKSIVSNKSERGSDVPATADIASSVASSPLISAVHRADLVVLTSLDDSSIVNIESHDDTITPTSTFSSFEQVLSDNITNAQTVSSDAITTKESEDFSKYKSGHNK